MHFINNAFGKNFSCHSNLSFKTSVLHHFPTFCINFLQLWKRNFSHVSYTPSCIESQFIWFKNYVILITILFTIKNFRVTILIFSISYVHLRKNSKTGITSEENFNSPIIYITHLHKFHTQFLKSGNEY